MENAVRRVSGHGHAVVHRLRQHYVARHRRFVRHRANRSDFRFHNRLDGAGKSYGNSTRVCVCV